MRTVTAPTRRPRSLRRSSVIRRASAGCRSRSRISTRLRAAAGSPPALGTVHLGLGADGHTASLFPGSPLVAERKRDVVVTEPYQGRRRMTLTLPVLNRARRILWIVTGSDKRTALAGLM